MKMEVRSEGTADSTPAKVQPSVSKPDYESAKERPYIQEEGQEDKRPSGASGRCERELSKPSSSRSYYMQEALNYFSHFKKGLFLYRTNGGYPIDNNIAERQVRPFAAMRKVIEHFGSEDGAEKMSAYLSIVSTILMKGASVWNFFGDFFEDMITGGRKHLALLNLSLG